MKTHSSQTMKKFLMGMFIISIAPLIAGIYGLLHDQLTYTISEEYYTKFKFIQFGLVNEGDSGSLPNARLGVSKVGFLASWWMGLPIGLILGLIGFIHKDEYKMLMITIKAYGITLIMAFFTGLVGLIYGYYYLSKIGVNWWLPDNLVEPECFIAVGSMHNFSYLGGILGLIVAIVYSLTNKEVRTKSINKSSIK